MAARVVVVVVTHVLDALAALVVPVVMDARVAVVMLARTGVIAHVGLIGAGQILAIINGR